MGKNLSFNLILNERVQKLLDDFATVMNVHIVFFDRDGQPLKRGRGEECSSFCRKMQTDYFSYEDCCRLDLVMEKKCAESFRCESYICHAGLGEAVMPVAALTSTVPLAAGSIRMVSKRVKARSRAA